MVVAVGAVALLVRSDQPDDRAARADRTNAQILAAHSGRSPFAELVASHDPEAAARVTDVRRACGHLLAHDVGATIADPGGSRPATITVQGTDGDGAAASCTIEAYWVRWCIRRYKSERPDCDGAWVRSPASYWTDVDLGAFRLWRTTAWSVPSAR